MENEWLVTGIWVFAFVMIWASQRARAKALYFQGRYQEILAQQELSEHGPHLYLLTVRQQVADALGEREAIRWLDHIQLQWSQEGDDD